MESVVGSEIEEDCETVCETSISDSIVHNRYYRETDEFDEENQTEYVSLGQMTFNEWEKCERKRLEMLNEVIDLNARDRATQMEKTMKWWAECTALWRQKWSLVRNERDSARSTIDKLMQSLQDVQEDTLKYFEAKEEAELKVRELRNEIRELRSKLEPSEFNDNVQDTTVDNPINETVNQTCKV
ncbi:hypothetical protein M3Y94_01295800 [Aphelenchoides besseyi]|nr:hypothetical protein M3Y94_01295800 [Aphelenchoides besseyi]KAI6217620.1 hypothetical protein M3Y95_01208700 [Aphelenchoides besseyi]